MRRWARVALFAAALTASAASAADICRPELLGTLTDTELNRPATGADAAMLLKRAVELIEPALPALRRSNALPVESGHPAYSSVRYLHERRLLPAAWNPDSIEVGVWQEMLAGFLGWYKLSGQLPDAPVTAGDLLDDTMAALQRASDAVRPAALLATDPADNRRLSFWAVIWNWTVYPRLLVFRPDEDLSLDDLRGALVALGTCALRVENYVTAPQETATQLFLAHNDSRMYVVASRPDPGTWPYSVAPGEELDAFGFSLSELDGVRLYAAVFDGPAAGVGTILGLMSRVRTNMSPFTFFQHLEIPAR